jgi:hypothetical protein
MNIDIIKEWWKQFHKVMNSCKNFFLATFSSSTEVLKGDKKAKSKVEASVPLKKDGTPDRRYKRK